MDCAQSPGSQEEMLALIRQYVAKAKGLREVGGDKAFASIEQSIDGKTLSITSHELEEVLFRTDADGQDFIQVNFRSGSKILITETLIGFKPAPLAGLDMGKIPKVVTTPDIISVFEALQETLYSGETQDGELSVLRRVFDSVLTGGESIGFDLKKERSWLGRIPATAAKVAA